MTGYQKSKCSSKLVTQITTKEQVNNYRDKQMRERQKQRWNFTNWNKSD